MRTQSDTSWGRDSRAESLKEFLQELGTREIVGGLCSYPPCLWLLTHLPCGLLVSSTFSHKVHSIHTAADLRGCSAQTLAEGSCQG